MAPETAEAADQPTFHDADLDSLAGIEAPEGAETPATDEGAQQGADLGAQPGDSGQGGQAAGEAPPAAAPQTFSYRGKVYTPEQIAANPDLLRDLIASAEQLPNVSRANAEMQHKLQQRIDQIERQIQGQGAQPGARTAPGQPGQRPQGVPGGPNIGHLNPDQVAAAVRPVADQAAKQGWIEQDMVDLFPKASGQFMIHRDLLYDARSAIRELQQAVFSGQQERLRNDTRAMFDATLDGLSSKGEQFAPLKDPQARQGFEKYLLENFRDLPAEKVLTDDFLSRQWWAFNAETVAATLDSAGQTAAAAEVRKRARAAGGGNSGRLVDGGGPPQTDIGTDLLPDGFKFPAPRR